MCFLCNFVDLPPDVADRLKKLDILINTTLWCVFTAHYVYYTVFFIKGQHKEKHFSQSACNNRTRSEAELWFEMVDAQLGNSDLIDLFAPQRIQQHCFLLRHY